MNRLVRLVLGMAVAAGLTLYPSTAQWFSNRQVRATVNQLAATSDSPAQASVNNEALAAAANYNTKRAAGKVRITNESDDALYQSLLQVPGDATGKLMGYLEVPAIQLRLPFYHGTTDDILEHGAGHIYGTSLPVGGENTHAALSAHNGVPGVELFTRLPEVKEGDYFSLSVAGKTMWYQVYLVQEVDPYSMNAILPEEGRDLVTLVTCVPLGVNNRRLLVTGERSGPPPGEVLAGLTPWGEAIPWWAIWFIGIVGGTYVIGRYVVYRKDYLPAPVATGSPVVDALQTTGVSSAGSSVVSRRAVPSSTDGSVTTIGRHSTAYFAKDGSHA